MSPDSDPDLYQESWERLHHYLLPSAKVEEKVGIAQSSRASMTSHGAILTTAGAPGCERGDMKERMRKEKAALHPFALHRRLDEGLRTILHRALQASPHADSLHSAPDAGKEMASSVS
jgi:hypothetical protein